MNTFLTFSKSYTYHVSICGVATLIHHMSAYSMVIENHTLFFFFKNLYFIKKKKRGWNDLIVSQPYLPPVAFRSPGMSLEQLIKPCQKWWGKFSALAWTERKESDWWGVLPVSCIATCVLFYFRKYKTVEIIKRQVNMWVESQWTT